ncbi:MAG: helix-hairpin-helix domain-containing protein, partial [Candidatus Heimdallarchaeota archaeon]
MTSITNIANSLGKETVQRMKEVGIDSLEKLATSRIEDLLVIDGVGISNAKYYIEFARKHIERIKAKEKIFTLITKGVKLDTSRSTNIQSIPQPIDKINNNRIPISSIKKLASLSIEDLSKQKGMNAAEAQRYIEIAKKYLESMRKEEIIASTSRKESIKQSQPLGFVKFESKIPPQKMKPLISHEEKKVLTPHPDYKSLKNQIIEFKPLTKPKLDIKPIKTTPHNKEKLKKDLEKAEKKTQPEIKTFFPLPTMQKIRFLHFKIKKLEEALDKKEDFSFSDLNNIIEYIKILNVNYKTQSQIRIFKELDITPFYYDPIAKNEIKIWDLIFECSRVLWIAAQAYAYLSNKFESEKLMENAIV